MIFFIIFKNDSGPIILFYFTSIYSKNFVDVTITANWVEQCNIPYNAQWEGR